MPVVKNARFRERTLNEILRNRNRKYTLDQIRMELSRRLGTDISRSTLYADMAHLKEEYGCVIVKNYHGQYFYEDPEFTIVLDNAPLDNEDKKLLEMATSIFRIFSSSPIYAKFQSTIDKILTGSKIT
jgi:hypothetical protein